MSGTRLRRHVPAGVPIVSVAKGIENETLLRPTQVVHDVAGRRGTGDAAVRLRGPTSPGSWRAICRRRRWRHRRMQLAERVQAAFSTQWLRVYTNPDVVGVELAGATKNVIAIAAGILDGLARGTTPRRRW